MKSSTLTRIAMSIGALFSLLSMSAYDFECDGIYYDVISLSDRTVKVVGCADGTSYLTIKGEFPLNGRQMKVEEIAKEAFKKREDLITLEVENVTEIGEEAFRGCTNLTSVSLKNVQTIGVRSFLCNYSLVNLDLSGSRVISSDAFMDCHSLTNLELLGVEEIGQRAFRDCPSLSRITIPSSVKEIKCDAFGLSSSSKSSPSELCFEHSNEVLNINQIYYDRSSGAFRYRTFARIYIDRNIITINPKDRNNYGFLYESFIKEGCIIIGPNITFCPNFYGATIDGEIDFTNLNITSISDNAFRGCQLKKVTLSDRITEIGSYAFSQNSLSSIAVPASVQSIGEGAFSDNELTDVDFKASVDEIAENLFKGNAQLETFSFPCTVRTIGKNAFTDCKLSSLTIPATIELIRENAFHHCELTNLIIEESSIPLQLVREKESTTKRLGDMHNSEAEAAADPTVKYHFMVTPFHTGATITSMDIRRPLVVSEEDIQTSGDPVGSANYFRYIVDTYEYSLLFASGGLEALTIGEELREFGEVKDPECYEFKDYYTQNDGAYCDLHKVTIYSGSDIFPPKLGKLKTLNCLSKIPPVCHSEFPVGVYLSATLNVPLGAKEAYESAPVWKDFWNIQESDFSGIDNIDTDTESRIKVYVDGRSIYIGGEPNNPIVVITDISGKTIYHGYKENIPPIGEGVYMVTVDDKVYKTLVK